MKHTFLLIGQSNMAGRGRIGEVDPIENEHVYMLRNGRWRVFSSPVNPDRPFSGIGLCESFADAYQKDHGVDVGLIPCADGGTQILQWQKGGVLFDHAVFQTGLAERTGTLAGVLWHQGESDCFDGHPEHYEERFEAFYRDLCEALHLEDIPFIIGGLGDFLSELPEEKHHYQDVNETLKRIAGRHPMMRFVSAEGLEGYPDHLHFTAKSQREFGLRYYEAFKQVEDKDRVFYEKPDEEEWMRTVLDEF